jgi:hypothetical protein
VAHKLHRRHEVRFGHNFGQQVGNNLGIGLRCEVHPPGLQLRPEFGEVLDDAVVDHGYSAVFAHVGVSVVVRRPTVGRPPSVADARFVNLPAFLRTSSRPSLITATPAES